MVGQWLGANAPDRVGRLVLANTSARIGAPEVWDQRIETVRAMGMGAIVPGVIDRWFTAPFRQGAPEAVAKVRAMLEATDPEGYVACCAAVRDMDLRDAIRGIRAPTLVIAGHHDLPTPPEHARLIADSIPGARMVTLDAAHLSNVEAQAEFTEGRPRLPGRLRRRWTSASATTKGWPGAARCWAGRTSTARWRGGAS